MEFFKSDTLITRRDFLKLLGLTVAVSLFKPERFALYSFERRRLNIRKNTILSYKDIKPFMKFIPPSAVVASHLKILKQLEFKQIDII